MTPVVDVHASFPANRPQPGTWYKCAEDYAEVAREQPKGPFESRF